ncbi:MAG: hypothetical protein KAI47_18500, partial [Deltaproteobacteria bacterium]|nr:hypothetical protein [Deltaproteobacteria bacterium]
PAIFTQGWHPSWLLESRDGVVLHLSAAAVPRPGVVSGWDFAKRSPKPTRRLVPSGSVYFVRIEGDDASIGRWIDKLWWQPVSDNSQDRLNGFGLCVLGTDPKLPAGKDQR